IKKNLNIPIKPLHIVSFQCTQDSKPFGIEKRWKQAKNLENDKTKSMLLLDELGLAERSSHSPLKILHHLLENPDISFVGLSNWPLDAAKMNRVVMHRIPNPTSKELKKIGKKMLGDYKNVQASKIMIFGLADVFLWLRDHLDSSAQFRWKENLLGTRDCYALFHYFLFKKQQGEFFEGIMRNLGGYKGKKYQKTLKFAIARARRIPKNEILFFMNKYTPMKCVELNLKDFNCRHCMLICKTPSSWQMLLDHNVLQYTNTVYLFESKFVADTTTMTNYDHLHKIINCMEMGKTV
ncbi:hypothetical protein RFI_38310, partial [Reticulomyxa filosa]